MSQRADVTAGDVMMNCSCDGGNGSCSVTSTDGKTSTVTKETAILYRILRLSERNHFRRVARRP